MENESNIELICRLCAKSEGTLISLFEACNLKEKIYKCTSIMIENGVVGLSNLICNYCHSNILNMYDFRENCIRIQSILLKKIKDSAKTLDISHSLNCFITEVVNLKEEHINNILDNNDVEEKQITFTNNLNSSIEVLLPQLDSSITSTDQVKEDLNILNKLSSIQNNENEQTNVVKKNKKVPNSSRQSSKQLSKEQRKLKYKSLLRPCDMCGKMVEKSRMQSHINQHLGHQPYICNIERCDKSFYCPYMLTNHKRNHHSSIMFTCETCGKSYRLQKSLYNHKQKHKEPKYICKICGKKYKNSTYLKQHMRAHTGERPYQCPHCSRAFATSYNLKAHLRSHTKEKPFVCSHCSIAYGYNSLLKAHIEKCHTIVN